jgi:hypothetical protein
VSSDYDDQLHFLWLHTCVADGDGFRVKTSGWESGGDIHYTGSDVIASDDRDLEVWRWIAAHRRCFPPLISRGDFANIINRSREGLPDPKVPEDGFYLISVDWSGPAVASRKAVEAANLLRPLPRPLRIINGDSDEGARLFPHLTGLFHGWGEMLGFSSGECDQFSSLGRSLESLQLSIDFLYECGGRSRRKETNQE